MQFIDIVVHTEQKKFGLDIAFPTRQKSSEAVVVFQDSESPSQIPE